LPFACVVLECADAEGGPPPSLLHSLRERGTQLILAQLEEREPSGGFHRAATSPSSTPRSKRPEKTARLDPEWFDAVFDKVVVLTGEEGRGKSPLERYWSDKGIIPEQALCFCCTERGARHFAAAEAGFIVSADFNHVWRLPSSDCHKGALRLPGADVAATECPTARQLAWLHTVFTMKLWCTCLWLCPPVGEFSQLQGSGPSATDRALLTAVRSPTVGALGHPAWVWQDLSKEKVAGPVCTCTFGRETLACPDWTPMEPRIKYTHSRAAMEIKDFPKIDVYCHSLDAGAAEVNSTAEVVDLDGCRVRVANKRLASFARSGHAATDLSLTVLEPGRRNGMPNMCIRSSLRLEQFSPDFELAGKPEVDQDLAMLKGTYVDNIGRSISVTCWHRVVRDDGRGDVQIVLEKQTSRDQVSVALATRAWGPVRPGAERKCPSLDFIISNPRKGSRYTIEKIVIVTVRGAPDATPLLRMRTLDLTRASRAREIAGAAKEGVGDLAPFAEIEEEHRSAWRAEWDRADIEVVGYRKAARFQRVVRLFRFHQVSQGQTLRSGQTKVPELVRQLFDGMHRELCHSEDFDERLPKDRPSSVILSRIIQPDPRFPTIRFEPRVPPACSRMMFNCALGGRWHRFTLTPGTVQILVQGPTQGESHLFGDHIKVPPKFLIPSQETGEGGVEVCTLPWHEVQVHHSLTELGRPDGSAGGFYSIMRRTRFTRVEVLSRLLKDWAPGEEETAYNDEVLTAPLRGALARLQSAPRPPGWRRGDSEDLHALQADATTRVQVMLEYEKKELARDILFLSGIYTKVEGCIVGGKDLVEPEMLTAQEAKRRCYSIPGCKGFSFQHEPHHCFSDPEPKNADGVPMIVQIHFRDSVEVSGLGCTSWLYTDGETALLALMRQQHEEKFCKWSEPLATPPGGRSRMCSSESIEEEEEEDGEEEHELSAGAYLKNKSGRVPSWEAFSEAVNAVLRAAAGHGESAGALAGAFKERAAQKITREDSKEPRPFKNLITDRDGTVNNYCDRYSSSVQSAYNAAWLSHFARHCTENAVFVTAAPLGGRPSAEGLMELCVAPRGEFTYTGSKGREYFDLITQRVLEAADLPQEQRELVDELHRRILALCSKPGNMKFLGIGSGLQKKFGEVTMARNDPACSVSEPESRRFMAAVRRVKEELDPDGTMLDLHDTGTDMELFPRAVAGASQSFDKGSGVLGLEEKLKLGISIGPNIVCGDTGSDLAMVVAALKLMCGEDMVKVWKDRMKKEDTPDDDPNLEEMAPRNTSKTAVFFEGEQFVAHASEMPGQSSQSLGMASTYSEARNSEASEAVEDAEFERKMREAEEAERRAKEEEAEAREAASGLAVLFVVSLKENEKSPNLVKDVRRWCEYSGAHCAIVPSPDVLIAGLRRYANQIAGRSVIEPTAQAAVEEEDGEQKQDEEGAAQGEVEQPGLDGQACNGDSKENGQEQQAVEAAGVGIEVETAGEAMVLGMDLQALQSVTTGPNVD